MQQYPATRVINMDETNWKMVASGHATWSKKGTESVHNCQIDNDAKEGLTVIASIDAGGHLLTIGTGKNSTISEAVRIPWNSLAFNVGVWLDKRRHHLSLLGEIVHDSRSRGRRMKG
jgi:hypothetical protein